MTTTSEDVWRILAELATAQAELTAAQKETDKQLKETDLLLKEVSLLEQAFAKDAKKTVQQIADEAKTAVSAFHRFRVGQ